MACSIMLIFIVEHHICLWIVQGKSKSTISNKEQMLGVPGIPTILFLFISKTRSFDIFLNKVLGKEESLFLLSLSSSRLVRSSKQLLSRISI